MRAELDRRSFILIAAAASTAASTPARDGLITLVGYNDMKEMLTALNVAFMAFHPKLCVVMDLPGTRFAPEALAAGRSVLAPMGARFTPEQNAQFLAATTSKPAGFRFAHASLDAKALSGPNGIFVHRDNPLRVISLKTARRLFTVADPAYWRDLGVSGPLQNQPIVVIGLAPQTPLALEFQQAAFPTAEFARAYRGFGQSREVIDFIGRQPAAIGFAALNRGSDLVRSLAIRHDDRSPPVIATNATLQAGLYPLDRHLWFYARTYGKGRLSALARTYLAFVLSRPGQAIIGSGSLGYLPLSERERRGELAKLGQ